MVTSHNDTSVNLSNPQDGSGNNLHKKGQEGLWSLEHQTLQRRSRSVQNRLVRSSRFVQDRLVRRSRSVLDRLERRSRFVCVPAGLCERSVKLPL